MYLFSSTFPFFVLSYYFLIISPVTMKSRLVIRVRERYVYVLGKAREFIGASETDYCWYLKQPITAVGKSNKGFYNYSLSGRLVSVDSTNETLTLSCSDGKNYVLHFKFEKTDEKDWVLTRAGINTKDKNSERYFLFNTADINRSIEKDPYFKENQLYGAIWTDSRELTEIYRAMKDNTKKPINTIDTPVRPLLRY